MNEFPDPPPPLDDDDLAGIELDDDIEFEELEYYASSEDDDLMKEVSDE